ARRRAGEWRVSSPSRRSGRSCCWPAAEFCSAWPSARWWSRVVEALTRYVQISAVWVRASRAYPLSWWMLVVGGFLITGVEFVGIWILFQNVDNLGGF